MKTAGSQDRFIAVLSLAFLVGVGLTSAVYWLFVAPKKVDQEASAASLSKSVPSTSLLIQTQEASSTSESLASDVRSVKDLEGIKSTFEHGLALRNHLANLDEAQTVDLLKQTQDVLSETVRSSLQSAIVQRLAHLNPDLALSEVLDMNTQAHTGDFVSSIFQEWAHYDLDRAVSRARTLDEHTKNTALKAILQERSDLSEDILRTIGRDLGNEQLAKTAIVQRRIAEAMGDPERAWKEVAVKLQDDRANVLTISRVASAWVESDGLGVLDQIQQSLTNGAVRQPVIGNVLARIARTDPADAFQYALTIDGDPFHSALQNVASNWSNSDPRAALAAASEIEQRSKRKTVEESIVRIWAFNKPNEVLEGIGSLPAHLQETAMTSALSKMAREFPEEAASLVAAMEPGPIKSSAAESTASTWVYRDHDAAVHWILNDPGIEEYRSQLLSSILHRLVQVNPQLAMTIALSQPIEESEDSMGMLGIGPIGMESNVIQSLAWSNLDKAIELFPQVREGQTKLIAFRSITASLVNAREIDRAFSMIQQIPESDRPEFYFAFSGTWAGSDPEGMLNSMDRLPSKEVKSRAALVLLATNNIAKSLSDEQVELARDYLSEEDAKALDEGDAELLQSLFLGF